MGWIDFNSERIIRTVAEIKLDYDRVIRGAGWLSSCAEECRKSSKRIREDLNGTLQGVWQGEAAEAAMQKLLIVANDTAAIAEELYSVAGKVRYTADRLKASDEAAAAIAADIQG